jgi:hypothetical protein
LNWRSRQMASALELVPHSPKIVGSNPTPQPPLLNSDRARSKRSPLRQRASPCSRSRPPGFLGWGDCDALDQPAKDLERLRLRGGLGAMALCPSCAGLFPSLSVHPCLYSLPRMARTILPAFVQFPKEAAIIGRLLAGYGELEFDLCNCLRAAVVQGGLRFIQLDNAAKGEDDNMPMKVRAIDEPLLVEQEAFFAYTSECLWYLSLESNRWSGGSGC